jgi:sarcosine oxidase subunit alpha
MSAARQGTRLGPESVRFTFDGRDVVARAGDTSTSALLANGVRLMGRSVKYRRVRGTFTAGIEEPNALFSVGEAPGILSNVPGPQLLVREGLQVRSQNRWPSLRHDLNALLQIGGGFFGAGFYYKTFMWPSWHAYEGIIRRLAGLGEAPGVCDLPPVDVEHLCADVLIAGAGPSGLSAALAASRAGARVVMCDREPVCGGELEFEGGTIESGTGSSRQAMAWVADTLRELGDRRVRVLTDTAVVGGSSGLMIAHRQRGGLAGADEVYRIRPRTFVIAAGAVERPIAFVDNDLPGVMLIGAAERYLARYGVRAAQRAVLFGNHDRLYAAAARLLAGGVGIAAIVDTRNEAEALASSSVRDTLRRDGIECLMGHAVLAARGRLEVQGARIAPIASPDGSRDVTCDAILVSGGWSPAIHPGLHEGGTKSFLAHRAAFIATDQPGWRAGCGACGGAFELNEVLAEGYAAGERAARNASCGGSGQAAPAGRGDPDPKLAPFWRSPAPRAAEKKQFVDLQNDVTVADLRQSLEEGFTDIEHIKRYTTLGVGTEQGRTGGVLGAAIVAELSGGALRGVGTSRTRPPYQPVTMNSLVASRAGLALRPTRRMPLHDWHAANGGELEPAGLWMRPRYYRANGSNPFDAGVAEAARVRKQGGIVDGSTLGKIEVAGPDAGAFLDSIYLTRASTIRVGRSKYMVNLREDGMVLDDGIVLRLTEDRFLAIVSSGHAGHMLSHFEFWRDAVARPWEAAITDVTEAWAVIVVAGPQSREKLRAVLGAQWHGSLGSLTHMAFADGKWQGRALRVLRASFSGELAFELHCRPAIAVDLWQSLVDAGLAPYGLEALDILRVEKGYLVTSEINGQATPMDLGMESLMKLGNPCVGRALLDREAFHEAERPKLVGLQTADMKARFLAGAQITTHHDPGRSVGHVTSAVFSPTLGRWIGLALVGRHLGGLGTNLIARDPLRHLETHVTVVPAVHFDPGGERMRA